MIIGSDFSYLLVAASAGHLAWSPDTPTPTAAARSPSLATKPWRSSAGAVIICSGDVRCGLWLGVLAFKDYDLSTDRNLLSWQRPTWRAGLRRSSGICLLSRKMFSAVCIVFAGLPSECAMMAWVFSKEGRRVIACVCRGLDASAVVFMQSLDSVRNNINSDA